MDQTEVFSRVRRVLEDELGVPGDRIRPEANLRDDLEMDSLDRVEFVTAMEGELGGRIESSQVEQVRTIQDVVDAVVAASRDQRPSAAS